MGTIYVSYQGVMLGMVVIAYQMWREGSEVEKVKKSDKVAKTCGIIASNLLTLTMNICILTLAHKQGK